MNVNWTPEPAHTRRPKNAHQTMAWTLWIFSALLLVAWIASMAAGIGGRVHVLLLAFALIQLVNILLAFNYVEYLEPMKAARARIMRWRTRRVKGQDGWHNVPSKAPVSPDEHMGEQPGGPRVGP